ncbi:MAG: tol-pal system protein YbgF [Cypionkella sp.]
MSNRMLKHGLIVALALLPLSAVAQDKAQTLADVKSELSQLQADFNALKSELVSTGAVQSGAAGGDALQRLDAIEAALQRLTNKSEEIELKVNRVASDGTARIADMEFRICEQTEGCDPGNMPETPALGGDTGAASAPAAAAVVTAPTTADTGPELAIGEKSDFDRAKGVLGQGDFRTAADLFKTFTESYPGSPLTQEAQYSRGEALRQAGDTAEASRAYLDAFSGKPDGPFAPQSLLGLGQGLGALGQTQDACVTLGEVVNRFMGTDSATKAQTAMAGLACQ